MKTKRFRALDMWALAMDFGPRATSPESTQTVDGTQSAREGIVPPAVTPLDMRGRAQNALPPQATDDGPSDCRIIPEQLK
jgi:hypothetical protein